MITARNSIKEFIKSQSTMEAFADQMEVSRQTLYNILNDENVSSDMVAKLLNATGFDFEKAFEVKGE